jgi:uncharacterized protein YdeI (BOF family)
MANVRGTIIIALFACVAPAVAAGESNFSIPAGASSSSHGFSTPAGAQSNGPFVSSSGFSTPAGSASNMAVRGQVTDIQGDTYIVRDEYGREVRVQPGKDIRLDYTPRLGDNIEAQLNNGRATSLVRAPGTSEGSGASAGEGSTAGK